MKIFFAVFKVSCFLLLLQSHAVFAKALIEVTDYNLPRADSTAPQSFTVSLKISGITEEIAETKYVENLEIFIPKISSTNQVPVDGVATELEMANHEFIVRVQNEEIENDEEFLGQKIAFLTLEFAASSSEGLVNAVDSNQNLTMTLEWLGEDTSDKLTSTLVPSTVPSEAPENIRTANVFRSVYAEWNAYSEVSFLDMDSPKKPNGVDLFLTTTDQGPIQTAGLVYGSDTAATCTIQTDIASINADPNCVTCSAANTYIDAANLNATLQTKRIASNSFSGGFAELDPDIYYVIFARYATNGIAHSTCLVGKPNIDVTLTEFLNQNEDSRQTDPRCFLATAVYDRQLDHPNLRKLRHFRDQTLQKSWVGRGLIQFYYWASPPLANWIEDKPRLKKAVRAVLDQGISSAWEE